jgi:hypothetical protein
MTGEWHQYQGDLLYVLSTGRVQAIVSPTPDGYYQWGWLNPLTGLLGRPTYRGMTPTLQKAKRSVETIHERRTRYLRTGKTN